METVPGRGSALVQLTSLKQDVFHVAANLAGKEGFSTLILDCLGRIRSCRAPAEKIFRANQGRMTGRAISEFITGLYLGDDSPSYNARYLCHLSADTEWRRFEAQNADGVGFTVEVKLSRTVLDGEEVFLLSVHRPEAATCR